ncbi:MAG TPA: hypothetical protein VNZ45_15545, partial [Bacteroidia bacterium]|nr:hypothetical protein [Bacteroidia bacterium]
GVVILISVLHNAPALILWIVCIGVVAIGLALLAYFKGRRVLPLLFGDDTMDKYYHMATLGRFLGYTIIICLLLSLVIALAFFN